MPRESLTMTMEERYASQRAGGAYDAKTAGDATVDNMSNDYADGFTKGGKDTNLPKKIPLTGKIKNENSFSDDFANGFTDHTRRGEPVSPDTKFPKKIPTTGRIGLVNFFNNEFAYGFTASGLNTDLPRKDSGLVAGLDKHRYSGAG